MAACCIPESLDDKRRIFVYDSLLVNARNVFFLYKDKKAVGFRYSMRTVSVASSKEARRKFLNP